MRAKFLSAEYSVGLFVFSMSSGELMHVRGAVIK